MKGAFQYSNERIEFHIKIKEQTLSPVAPILKLPRPLETANLITCGYFINIILLVDTYEIKYEYITY